MCFKGKELEAPNGAFTIKRGDTNEVEILKEHPSFKDKFCKGFSEYDTEIWKVIHETQLDRQTVIKLSEEQFYDLVVKGECIDKLKIEAFWEGKLFDSNIMKRMHSEHILLDEYKQKVKGVIDKYIGEYTKGIKFGRPINPMKLLKELGLE